MSLVRLVSVSIVASGVRTGSYHRNSWSVHDNKVTRWLDAPRDLLSMAANLGKSSPTGEDDGKPGRCFGSRDAVDRGCHLSNEQLTSDS